LLWLHSIENKVSYGIKQHSMIEKAIIPTSKMNLIFCEIREDYVHEVNTDFKALS